MNTKLLEFKNQRDNIIRGILVENDSKDHIAVMLGGFERATSTERKFKLLADELVKNEIASLRFDVADMGLSDGDFYKMTMQTIANDLLAVVENLKTLGFKKVSFVGHSQAACAVSLLLKEIEFEKLVLLAPALNQDELQRLWFAQEKNPLEKIGWNNYREKLDEEEFQKAISQDVITKSHLLNAQFKQMNSNLNYEENFKEYDLNRILVVRGDGDKVCPIESLAIEFPNKILVEGGDHDMEKPGMIEQWLRDVIIFLS